MPGRRYNLDQRMTQVETVLRIMAQHGIKPEATAYEIAKKIDMATGGNVYAILSEMVALGRLTVRDVMHRPNVEKTLYSLPEGTYQLSEDREIKINIGGKSYQEKLI